MNQHRGTSIRELVTNWIWEVRLSFLVRVVERTQGKAQALGVGGGEMRHSGSLLPSWAP